MKKLLVLIALLLAISTFPQQTYAGSTHKSASAQLQPIYIEPEADKRIVALENIFKKYDSPLVNEAKNYVEYADYYNIDWKLLPAISGLESTYGLHLIDGSYNAYGWGGGRIYFQDWKHGIQVISKALRENYYDRGATEPYSIGSIYAESPTWGIRVSTIMNAIDNEYIRLESEEILTPSI